MPSPSEDIKSRLDIVELIQSYIRLQKAGANYKALCPFHSEKTPSFNVSPTRQIWHCFGCGLGGDHFKFVMQIEGVEFPEALEILAKRAGVTIRREDPRLRSERSRMHALVEEAANIFGSALHAAKNPDVRISPQLAYVKARGLTDDTIKLFRIGYAPDSWDFLTRALKQKGFGNEEIVKAGLAVKSEQGSYYDRFRSRIIFPVADASGRIVGFSGRIFGEGIENRGQGIGASEEKTGSNRERTASAKYINTPQTLIYDKSRVLYGFDKAKEAIRKENTVVLVEGQMDVVLSHQAGVKNAVAVSGTALTAPQLQILKRLAKAIVSSFDRDAAGEAATKRSLDLAAGFEFERKVAILPQGLKDPADAVLKNPEIWRSAVLSARPIVQFFLETALARHNRRDSAGKKAIAESVLPEIRILTSEVEKSHWIQALAREIEVPEEVLWRELKKTKPASSETFLAPDAVLPVQPNRKMQLESLLIGTLILYPKEGKMYLADLPRHAITDSTHREILEAVEHIIQQNISEHEALIASLAENIREASKYLAFQAEVILERIENVKERANELAVCMRELEREWAREKLRSLAGDITAAERAGNRELVTSLLEEFQTITKTVQ